MYASGYAPKTPKSRKNGAMKRYGEYLVSSRLSRLPRPGRVGRGAGATGGRASSWTAMTRDSFPPCGRHPLPGTARTRCSGYLAAAFSALATASVQPCSGERLPSSTLRTAFSTSVRTAWFFGPM